MKERLNYRCDLHSDPYDCPDNLVVYVPQFDEYGLIIHDGGRSYITINYCPWCGTKLPKSKRDEWFDALDALGYQSPSEQRIPEEFLTDEWYSTKASKKSHGESAAIMRDYVSGSPAAERRRRT